MNKKKMLMAALLLLGAGLVYWLLSPREAPPSEAPPSEPPALSYAGNTLSEEKDGRKSWELTAEVIEIDAQTQDTLLKNVRGVFYPQNGETVTMTAPQAAYRADGGQIAAAGGVRTVSGDTILDADCVFYDTQTERFFGQGNVRLTRGDTVLTGDRLDADDAFEKFKVTGNAHIVQGGK